MKKIYTDYDQGRILRNCLRTRGFNSFVGIMSNTPGSNGYKTLNVYEIKDENRRTIELLIDTNRYTTVPVFCLSDLLSVCDRIGVKYNDINIQYEDIGFNEIVNRIVRHEKG